MDRTPWWDVKGVALNNELLEYREKYKLTKALV